MTDFDDLTEAARQAARNAVYLVAHEGWYVRPADGTPVECDGERLGYHLPDACADAVMDALRTRLALMRQVIDRYEIVLSRAAKAAPASIDDTLGELLMRLDGCPECDQREHCPDCGCFCDCEGPERRLPADPRRRQL